MINKPDKVVAESIKTKLIEKKLIKDSHSTNIINNLSSGNISEQDWKLMAELSLENVEGKSDAQKN
jgi:hypothetical protein